MRTGDSAELPASPRGGLGLDAVAGADVAADDACASGGVKGETAGSGAAAAGAGVGIRGTVLPSEGLAAVLLVGTLAAAGRLAATGDGGALRLA